MGAAEEVAFALLCYALRLVRLITNAWVGGLFFFLLGRRPGHKKMRHCDGVAVAAAARR